MTETQIGVCRWGVVLKRNGAYIIENAQGVRIHTTPRYLLEHAILDPISHRLAQIDDQEDNMLCKHLFNW